MIVDIHFKYVNQNRTDVIKQNECIGRILKVPYADSYDWRFQSKDKLQLTNQQMVCIADKLRMKNEHVSKIA